MRRSYAAEKLLQSFTEQTEGRWLAVGFEMFRKSPSEQLLVDKIAKIVDNSLSFTLKRKLHFS